MTTTPPPDASGVYISQGQIYQELRRQSDILVRLTVQLERGRYEERLSALERRVWSAAGTAGGLGGGLGGLLVWLTQLIGGG